MPDEVSVQIMCFILIARLGHENRKRYNDLVLASLSTYPGLDETLIKNWDVASGPFLAVVWQEYRQRVRMVSKLIGPGVDPYFQNFCRNYILHEQFLNFPGPEVHGQKLILHLAVIKFLFFSHPTIYELLKEEKPLDSSTIDSCFVSVVQIYMRNISHNIPLFEKLISALNSRESAALSGLACLFKA